MPRASDCVGFDTGGGFVHDDASSGEHMTRGSRIAVVSVVLVVAAVVALALLRNSLLGWATVRFIRASTGLDLSIESMKVQVARPSVRIHGMTIRNPPGFESGEAIRFREIFIAYDRSALWRREPRFKQIVIDMPQLVMVRNAGGELNWERIGAEVSRRTKNPAGAGGTVPQQPGESPGMPSDPGTEGPQPGTPGGRPATPAPAYKVDEFVVRIGAIEMRDFRSGKPDPDVRRMDLGFEHTVRDVTDFNAAGQEIGGMLLIRAAPILLMSAIDELSRASSGDGGALLKNFEKGAQKLLKGIGADTGTATNLAEKGAAELQRALKKLF